MTIKVRRVDTNKPKGDWGRHGTNTPMAKLHASTKLVEVLRIEREGTTPAQYGFQIQPILNGDSSDLQILADTPGTGLGIYSRDAAGTAMLGLGINQNGNVGINKLAPTKALDVVGDANITGNFSAANINAGNLGIAGPATAGSLNVSGPASVGSLSSPGNLQVSGGTNLATGSGNVGIGTTSPSAKLDVNGSIKFNSQKLCRVAVPNMFSFSTLVPSSWTQGTCSGFMSSAGGIQFQLGCIFANSFSLGTANGGIPSPNCGW